MDMMHREALLWQNSNIYLLSYLQHFRLTLLMSGPALCLTVQNVAANCRCILDEAHLIRNGRTQTAKAAAEINAARRCVVILLLFRCRLHSCM